MSNLFIDLAHRGKNSWWRYAIGMVFSLLMLMAVGSAVSLGLLSLYVATDNNPLTKMASPEVMEAGKGIVVGVSPLIEYVGGNVAFLLFLLGIWLSVKLLHKRGLVSLITPYARISWKRVAQGFWVFFVLIFLEIMVSYALSPQDYTLSFQLVPFLLFLPLVFLITPLQTTTEELFFRGYLLQGIGTRFGKWTAAILTSLLFASLHFANPEVAGQSGFEAQVSIVLHFVMLAAFLAWLTLKDNTLELAIGVHAANNIAAFLFVTGDADVTVVQSPAIFTTSKIEASFASLFLMALALIIFSFVVFRMMKRPMLPVASQEP